MDVCRSGNGYRLVRLWGELSTLLFSTPENTTDMSKRKRTNDYNVEVNVDVELEEELQEEEKDTYADTEEVPPGSRRPTASADDISNYLQQNFASKDTIGTIAGIKKLHDNVYHVWKSIYDFIKTRREFVPEDIQQQHRWLLADDTLNRLSTRFPSLDVECVRRERDKYLGCSDKESADHTPLLYLLSPVIVHLRLRSIHSEFEEVHGILKLMTLFAMLPSTIDDDADEPPTEQFYDLIRGFIGITWPRNISTIRNSSRRISRLSGTIQRRVKM